MQGERPLDIVIAAWHLRNFNVGLGRYARELIAALGRVDQVNRYTVLLPDSHGELSARPNVRYRVVRVPMFKRRVWEQLAPFFGGPCDVLHFPYDSCVSWKRSKFMVTIHDLKPLLVGARPTRRNLNERIESLVVGDRWSKIDHIVTDSACSQRDILAHLPVTADRVSVVFPGVDLARFRPAEAGVAAPERPYILCVAGDDPMKNVETLVDAFALLPAELRAAHDLVLAGDVQKRSVVRERVVAHGLEPQVRFPGLVDDATLVGLYQQARLFVFPSRYEGFGLPVLEAMACGCPVISSDASSLPEVAGDAGLLFNPSNAAELAKAMGRVVNDATLHTSLRARGLERARRFSWDQTARAMVAVYGQVAGRTGHGGRERAHPSPESFDKKGST